jgi:hypothetical protein
MEKPTKALRITHDIITMEVFMAIMGRPTELSSKNWAVVMPIIDTALSFDASWPQINVQLVQVSLIGETKYFKIPNRYQFQRHLQRKYNMTYAQYKEKRMENVKLSVKQKMYSEAMNGNTPLLIFLAKNYCGMSDTPGKFENNPTDQPAQLTLAYAKPSN